METHRKLEGDKRGALLDGLTTLEKRVLELAAMGRSNKQIAQALKLSEGTVRNYLSNVFAKLQVESLTEAAMFWWDKAKTI